MAPPKNTRTHSLTGFVARHLPPSHYTTRQANRILIIRNPEITDIRRNLKQGKCRVDWILSQDLEIFICFPNRQEFVNYCASRGHLFGPRAGFFIPTTATQSAPWTIITNKINTNDKGLLSDSDLESDSEPSNFKTVQTRKLKKPQT